MRHMVENPSPQYYYYIQEYNRTRLQRYPCLPFSHLDSSMSIVLYNPDRRVAAAAAVTTYVWLLAPGSLGVSVHAIERVESTRWKYKHIGGKGWACISTVSSWISSVAYLFQPCSHDGLNWNMSQFMYQFTTKLWEKKRQNKKASAVTQNCQMTVALRPKTGGNYTRGEKTCWQTWSTANYLSIFTKHQLIWGSDTNFPKGNPPPLFTIKHQRNMHLPSEDTNEGWVPFRQTPSQCLRHGATTKRCTLSPKMF